MAEHGDQMTRRRQCSTVKQVLDTSFYCVLDYGHQCPCEYRVTMSDLERLLRVQARLTMAGHEERIGRPPQSGYNLPLLNGGRPLEVVGSTGRKVSR